MTERAEQLSFDELIEKANLEEDDDVVGNLAVFPDDEPSSGEWVDVHDVLAEPTDEELEEGRRLGEEIDVENDDDTGVS